MDRWLHLPLSWIGRVNLIKMNILPRLLYPMQMLPLWITRKVAKSLERDLSKFIWHDKRPRLKMKTLQLPVDRGGLALPNILNYNLACHARIISEWLNDYLNGVCDHIDEWCCSPVTLLSLLTGSKKQIPSSIKNNSFIYNTVRAWGEIMSYTGRKGFSSSLTPIIGNKTFPPGINSSVFNLWYRKGIRVIGDLFSDDVLMSFAQVQTHFGIPNKHLFAFLQVRHFIQTDIVLPLGGPVRSPLDKRLTLYTQSRGLISYFYQFLDTWNKHNIDNVISTWERDLESEYEAEDWTASILSCSSTFCCNRLKETQYKILHRQHRTPYILNKFDPSRSSLCSKCKDTTGTYIHCFWQCSTISKFWSLISKELNNIFKCRIEKKPGLFLLSLPDRTLPLNPSNVMLLQKLLLLARKCILFNWIMDKPPTVTQWYRETFKILPMERLSARSKGSEDIFTKIWKPLLDYLPHDVATFCR